MRLGRKSIALAVAASAIPMAFANFSSNAATGPAWSFTKLVASQGGSEPGLDTGRDAAGNPLMYVHGTYGIPSHNKAWVREGNGAFTPITFSAPYNRLPGGGDADTAMRGDDVWFIDLWAGSNSIQYSPDKGKTWVTGTPFTTLPLSDRQWIEVGPTRINPVTQARETTIYATYQFIQPGLGTWLARSRDNGLTWDLHVPIQEGPGTGTNGIPIDVVSDGANRVAVAMISSGEMKVAVSTDGGENWDINSASNGVKDANGSLTGFTMNPDNPLQMAVSYPVSQGVQDGLTFNKIGVRVTHNGGLSWSNLIRLDPDVQPTDEMDWFPWIDWRGDKIAVAWYQSNSWVPGRNANNGVPTTHSWSVWYSESVDNGASFSAPAPIGSGPVKKGAICTVGLACDADRELGDFINLAIDVNGRSWITFVNTASNLLPGGGIYMAAQPVTP